MPYTPPGYDPEGGEFGPITPGKHAAVVESLELKYKHDDDDNPLWDRPYVTWAYVLAEGEFKNRKAWNNTSLLESSVNMPGGWYESGMAAIGETFPDEMYREWEEIEDMVDYAAQLVCGRMVTIAVANRKFQGRVQNDVQAVLPYQGDLPQLDTSEFAPEEEGSPVDEPEEKEEKPKSGKPPKTKGKAAPPKGKAPPKRAPPPRKSGAKDDVSF